MTPAPTLACPRCGAPMSLDTVRLLAKCPSCGAERTIERVAEGAPGPAPARKALGAPPFVLGLFLVTGVAMLAGYPFIRRIALPDHKAKPAEPKAPPKLVWDVTRPPLFRDLNGDGIDDLVGRYRPDESPDAQLYVGAFDGQTLQPLWSVGPLGSWVDGLGTVQLAAVQNLGLVTDSHGAIQLLELTSGKVVQRFAMPDPIRQACGDPSGVQRFWVETAAGGAFIEPNLRQPTPAERPEFCPKVAPGTSRRAHELSPKSVPVVEGFTPALVLNEGTSAVAMGTVGGVPTMVGFDPDRHVTRWQRAVTLDAAGVRPMVPLGADLASGTLYVPYQLATGRRLSAIDAGTGTPKWDIAIPGQGIGASPWERIIVGDARIYVPGPLGLAVYDSQTGAHKGTLGR